MSDLSPPSAPRCHRALLVNDDGIESMGIKLLEELVRTFTDDIWVVAPDEEKFVARLRARAPENWQDRLLTSMKRAEVPDIDTEDGGRHAQRGGLPFLRPAQVLR